MGDPQEKRKKMQFPTHAVLRICLNMHCFQAKVERIY